MDTELLEEIIAGTSDDLFEMAGGFDFTDELASLLNAKWRDKRSGPVVVSVTDLAWLLDGYARARLSTRTEEPKW